MLISNLLKYSEKITRQNSLLTVIEVGKLSIFYTFLNFHLAIFCAFAHRFPMVIL
jgi:hypothetical protein